MPGLGDLIDRLDPDVRLRGLQFESICKWFLTHDPGYRRELKTVWLWDEWPGRWGADAGIDLVAETYVGDFWAVQAKCYQADHPVTKRDLDKFLSESSRSLFSYRLLIATSDDLHGTARRTVDAQEKQVGLLLRSDLEHAQVDWRIDLDDLHAPTRIRKTPRPHQQEALTAVAAGFETGDRGQMVMACGTGKTLTALWVTELLKSDRTLVLVPSLSLLKDTLREWTAHATADFMFLPVCSDETVRGADPWVSSPSELGFPVTTNSDEIADFLRQEGPLVVFSTYQSSDRVADAQAAIGVRAFDLVVADEAHRVAGPGSSVFATVLDDTLIRAGRRLFTTATPRYFTDRIRKEAGEADFQIASMDDEAKFGPVFHCLSFGEAIGRDLLSDYQVTIIGVDDPTYRNLAERGVFVTRDGTEVADARTLAAHIGLAKAMRDFDLHKTISFHSRIDKARQFAEDFGDVVAWMPDAEQPNGELVTSYVSGKMSAGQRDLSIRRLGELEDHQRGLLSNARCLGEGIDVPTLDGVAFIDPKSSHIDIIQAVGRAIRKSEGKTVGTIILPVFIDTTEDPDTALDSSAFKPIWSVLKALRAHDENLAEQLDDLRRQYGRNRTTLALPSKIHIDLPTSIGQGFANAFEVRLVESATASWEFWYGLLSRFSDRQGHAMVPAKHTENGHLLGRWVNKQRVAFGKGTLPPQRVEALGAVDGWSWAPFEVRWEEGFDYLTAFADREGHARVKWGQTEGGFPLGQWVKVQRRLYAGSELSPDRVAKLEETPGWAWRRHADVWDERYALLERYAKEAGGSDPPQALVFEGVSLGAWASWQRHLSRQGALTAQRSESLEKLPGWEWDALNAKWNERYRLLQRYVEREKTSRAPRDYQASGIRLGQWVQEQRVAYRTGRISDDRISLLEAFDDWTWDRFTDQWENGFAALKLFVEANGSARVPSSEVDTEAFRVGQWVVVQRATHRRGNLSVERTRRLLGLPGWVWNEKDTQWEDAFSLLLEYVAAVGNSHVPATHRVGGRTGFRLGSWVSRQRSLYRKGQLPADRAERFGNIEGWVWEALGRRRRDDG